MPKEKQTVHNHRAVSHFAKMHPELVDAWNQTLLDALRVGVLLIDPETYQIVDVNTFAADMLGRKKTDLIGKLCHDSICTTKKDQCPICTHDYYADAAECELLRSDGVTIPIHKSVTLVEQNKKKLLLANFVDISEQKKAQKKAEQAEASIRTILQSVADGLIFTNMNNKIILISASAEAMLGKRLEDVLLQPFEAALKNEGLTAELLAIQDGEKEEASVEIDLEGESGITTRTIQVKPAVVRSGDGTPTGIITLLRDVSRERKLDRLKSEFIATAAHELRTPLTAVMGFSELLMNGNTFDEQQRTEFLSIIHNKAEVLGKIIDDFLSLERVDSGKLIHLNKNWADIESIVRRCTWDFQNTCLNHRFKIVLPEPTAMAFVDDRKLFQVLENLISNAVKFSPEGSCVHVFCEMSETEVRIAVSDEGIGMSSDEMERIFDKFYRIDASNTAKEGMGLGMAIAKSIIEAHGGQIGVESDIGKGTTVTFSLPREDQPAKTQ